MTAEILKIVACLTMLLDHIGYVENDYILRFIGRIAFPIFAYMVASGFRKSSDPYRYLLRILIFALITEPFYDHLFYKQYPYSNSGNVLFTLALALISIIIFDKMRGRGLWSIISLIPLGLSAYIAENMGFDYGLWGVVVVFLFYLVDGSSFVNKVLTATVGVIFSFRFVIMYFIDSVSYQIKPTDVAPVFPSNWYLAQSFAALSLIFILLYNGKRSFNIKNKYLRLVYQYAFYAFYPLHLLILDLIY